VRVEECRGEEMEGWRPGGLEASRGKRAADPVVSWAAAPPCPSTGVRTRALWFLRTLSIKEVGLNGTR
jgi:hypothetical protein